MTFLPSFLLRYCILLIHNCWRIVRHKPSIQCVSLMNEIKLAARAVAYNHLQICTLSINPMNTGKKTQGLQVSCAHLEISLVMLILLRFVTLNQFFLSFTETTLYRMYAFTFKRHIYCFSIIGQVFHSIPEKMSCKRKGVIKRFSPCQPISNSQPDSRLRK